MEKVIRLPAIDPRHYQYPFWRAMDSGCTRAVFSHHRRAGKDITHFAYMVREALKRVGTYYYYFPTLELAKKALWDNIVEFYSFGKCVAAGNMIDILCPPEIRKTKNNSETFVQLINNSRIKLGGTDNLDVIGMNGYGYAFSEWQKQKKEAFGYISPILRENGGWALFNGTMRGKNNHLYQDIHRNSNNPLWFTQWLKPEDTKEYYWINEEENIDVNPELISGIHPHTLQSYTNIQDLVDAGEISFSLARQEYLNDAVSLIGGSYYAYELMDLERGGRKNARVDIDSPTYTFWDLGGQDQKADKTCITWAQMDDNTGKVKVIDYYENYGHVRGHYMDAVNSKPYRYGGHYVPHDAKRTNDWTTESTMDTARVMYGIEMRAIPKTNSIADDIEITRRDFRNYDFVEDRTEELLIHLGNYHERESTGKPCHSNNCSICRGASHGADTIRMMATARQLGLIEDYLKEDKRSVEIYTTENYFIV